MSASFDEVPRHLRGGYRAREFARRLVDKFLEDDVPFMAGAIAFNILVALLPLAFLGVGLTGYILSARFPDPTAAVVALIADVLPDPGAALDMRRAIERSVSVLLEQRSGFTFFGALIFVWLATRLASTLRVSLREVFDIAQDRGVIGGKLFDVQMVLVGVSLLTLNLGLTASLTAWVEWGVDILHLRGSVVSAADVVFGHTLAFASIWALFLIIFRWVPARRIPWRTALIAATVSAILHESLKMLFSWYATEIADYGSMFGNLATLVAIVAWIYYGAIGFLLGGEVAQVYTMRSAIVVRVVRTDLDE